MTKTYALKFTCNLILFSLMVILTGCIGDPISRPEKVKGLPNTFRLPGRPSSDEKILAAWVSGRHRPHLWEIKATRDIPAKGFTVTAGVVPEGFEQIIPAQPEKFQPVRGSRYSIYIKENIHTDPKDSYLWAPAVWIAE